MANHLLQNNVLDPILSTIKIIFILFLFQLHDLVITSARLEDSGEYTCIADNGIDRDFVTATLTVVE